MSFKKVIILSISTLLLVTTPAFAKKGTESGGGGDASELRVNDIRSDILKWINEGGASELSLPAELSYGIYVDMMTDILKPKKVGIEFTDNQVIVNNAEKTCKGYFSTKKQAHILCNISRFSNTTAADQYKLIHHEFAGLVGIEKNEGSISDYSISSQITDFLSEQKVLKLAVRKSYANTSCKIIKATVPLEIANEDFKTKKEALDKLEDSKRRAKSHCEGMIYSNEKDYRGVDYSGFDQCEIIATKIEERTWRNSFTPSLDGTTTTEMFTIYGFKKSTFIPHISVRAVKYKDSNCY